jgi:hypothetical protein
VWLELGIIMNYQHIYPHHIENETVLWKAAITKKQQEKLDTLFKPGEDLHILIMNVEAFSTTKGC